MITKDADPRFVVALRYAADACEDLVERARKELADIEVSDSNLAPKTRDGLMEDDLVEWEEDVKVIRAAVAEWDRGTG